MTLRRGISIRRAIPGVILAVSAGLATASLHHASWDFEADEPGRIAVGFTEEVGRWEVVSDGGNRVLAQQAENRLPVFNLTFIDDTSSKNVDLSVRIKSAGGENERGGGLVWRAKDKDNYYVARYNPYVARHNPREPNFRLYKVEEGKLTQLDHADVPGDDEWHTLRISMKGDQIVGYLDDQKLLQAEDSTFLDVGKIGLWTRSDARTYFDDLMISAQ